MMNNKAKELELVNTNFVTPHGLDEETHYTSAYELAKITDYALNNKKFSTIVNTKSTTIHINGYAKTINNTNELLGNLNGVDGVKTGFTNNAGRCLVTSTTRNGHQIICVVLGADTKNIRTKDSIKLIEYTFSNFEYVNIKEKIENKFNEWKQDNINNINIIKGKTQTPKIELETIKYEEIPINKNDVKDIEIEIKCKNTLQAPILQDEIIGNVVVKVKDEVISTVNIKISEQIQKKGIQDYINQLLSNYNLYINMGLRNIKV